MLNFRNTLRKIAPAIIAGTMFFSSATPVLADQFDDQINAINAEIAAQKAVINHLQSQQNTLANKIANYNAQIARASNELALSQAKHEKLSTALVAAEATLVQKKAVLAGNIRTIYLQNQLSPIEVLASSGSISEFIDRQQYLSTLQESTGEIIGQITALKAQLESQRIEQEQLMAEQTVIRQGLQAQRTEVANLLAETEGQESAYQSRVASNSERVKQLKAQQAAYLEKLNGGGQYGGTGGYPAIWANACQDCLVDDWGMYNRECVSYSAWHRWANGKRMPYWGGRGNANQWPSNAMAAGILTNKTPAINSTAVFMGGPYGHVAQVIGIDGSMIKLAQYNADNTGRFSITTTHVNNIDWFIH